jgi:hypothetical protein
MAQHAMSPVRQPGASHCQLRLAPCSDQPLCPAPAALQTGKLCKVVNKGDMRHIQCNITDPSQASVLVYNGTAFSYNGIPFTNPGLSQPLYLGGTGTSATVKPAGELKLAVAAV